MCLTLDIGRGGFELDPQRVELLIEPAVGRDPRINGAANRFGGGLSGREDHNVISRE